jgi:phage gp46-like protein
MNDIFSGDPKLILDNDGVYISFIGGQPIMDQGLENQALISLFTGHGWWGNSLIDNEDQKIGSDFESTAKGSITLEKLRDIEQAAEKALDSDIFGDIEAVVTNPVSTKIDMNTIIKSPGKDPDQLLLTKNGQNWINQAVDPAYRKI